MSNSYSNYGYNIAWASAQQQSQQYAAQQGQVNAMQQVGQAGQIYGAGGSLGSLGYGSYYPFPDNTKYSEIELAYCHGEEVTFNDSGRNLIGIIGNVVPSIVYITVGKNVIGVSPYNVTKVDRLDKLHESNLYKMIEDPKPESTFSPGSNIIISQSGIAAATLTPYIFIP